MKSKKSQGISINTIIIAAIALIVLVILIAIFAGRMGIWGKGLDDESNKECDLSSNTVELAQNCPAERTMIAKFNNVPSGSVCCKK